VWDGAEVKHVCQSTLRTDNPVARLRYDGERAKLRLDEYIRAPRKGDPIRRRAEKLLFVRQRCFAEWPHIFDPRRPKKSDNETVAVIQEYFNGKVPADVVDAFLSEWDKR
jgi:hypothetical protein